MRISYNTHKNTQNIAVRQLSFDQAADFDLATALVMQDKRKAYSEERFVAIGYLGKRLHVLCFTPTPDGMRVISFRKANERERAVYEQSQS